MSLLAIDPGEKTGVAFFRDGLLSTCVVTGDVYEVVAERLVIEMPQYSRNATRDPQALIKVAVCVGRWLQATKAAKVETPFPVQWKGQLPKSVCATRVLNELKPVELTILWGDMQSFCGLSEDTIVRKMSNEKAWRSCTANNAFDALAMGLQTLGRLRLR